MKTTKERKTSEKLSISLKVAMAARVREEADAKGESVSEIIKRALALSFEQHGHPADLREVRMILTAANTIEEARELLNTTIVSGQFDFDDPLPPIDMTAEQRADYLTQRVKTRLARMRGKRK